MVNSWSITGADLGTVTGVAGGFTNIGNLTGGSNNDSFTVGVSGSVSGLIDGGGQSTSDSLDYSVVPGALTAQVGTDFTNIESVTGNGANGTLVGADATNTWMSSSADNITSVIYMVLFAFGCYNYI